MTKEKSFDYITKRKLSARVKAEGLTMADFENVWQFACPQHHSKMFEGKYCDGCIEDAFGVIEIIEEALERKRKKI